MDTRWCTLGVKSGTEATVSGLLHSSCSNFILEIFSPSLSVDRKAIKLRKGPPIIPFSGYIFVKISISDYSRFVEKVSKIRAHCRIISTDGETSFVTDKEIDDMKSALTSFKGNEQSVGISVGSHVRVTQGPFESYTGIVESIDKISSKARVKIVFCGQNADVSFSFDQLKVDS